MIALSRYAAGVEPTAPGYETWHVIPQMGNFASIKAGIPSVIGDIKVQIRQDEDGICTMKVVSPGGSAEIWVPVENEKAQISCSEGISSEFTGFKEAYRNLYAVYSIIQPGEYQFVSYGN